MSLGDSLLKSEKCTYPHVFQTWRTSFFCETQNKLFKKKHMFFYPYSEGLMLFRPQCFFFIIQFLG